MNGNAVYHHRGQPLWHLQRLLLMAEIATQLVRIDIVVHSRPGNRYPRLQAKLDQLSHGVFIKFPATIPFAVNNHSASEVSFFCHYGLSA